MKRPLRIISRLAWRADPPRNPRVWVSWQGRPVFLHHTAHRAPKGRTRKQRIADERLVMRELQQIAFSRGFSDISYNYVVMPSGRIYSGRGFEVKGAHTQGGAHGSKPFYNDHCGISLPGDYTRRKPTIMQRIAVRRLMRNLHQRAGTQRRLIPHRAVFATSCPGDQNMRAFKLTMRLP
jgi:hypothetical protein